MKEMIETLRESDDLLDVALAKHGYKQNRGKQATSFHIQGEGSRDCTQWIRDIAIPGRLLEGQVV